MVAAVLAVAAVAVAIAAIVRDNGSGDKTVQTVAGHRITQNLTNQSGISRVEKSAEAYEGVA